jgi:hypothetical protein
MNSVARFVVLGGMPLALVSLGVLTLLPSVVPPPEPQRVTSDTPEYCLHLLDQVSELVRAAPSPPPSDVTSLSAEGQHMCERGQTRAGILRLRHAMVLMTRRSSQSQYSVSADGNANTAARGPLATP